MPEIQSEQEKQQLTTQPMDPRLYYDYEGRFVKQHLERDRMRLLPRVVPPQLFAPGGHSLGDVRVFERFTAGPISSLTCRFLDLGEGERTPSERRIPSLTAFILEGDGTCVQDGTSHPFTAGDVIFVPPYTEYSIVAGPSGLRAWVPESRLWHVLGLLWHEHFEEHRMASEVESEVDADGQWNGYRFSKGVLDLEDDLVVAKGENPKRAEVFAARRAVGASETATSTSPYDDFLARLSRENALEEASPRVFRGADLQWEDTRQGRLKYYVTNWTELAGQDLELAVYDIPASQSTGRHRHIAEELLLVVSGSGHDLHDETSHPWKAGDLICIPPMTEHQHFNDGDTPAQLISVWLHHPANEFLGGIEHIEDASSWTGA
jgi:mannose-6-phosphate isomerase-like protein (cupin superfamily)